MKIKVDDKGFEARGHAGYAQAGQDIVCAGISAILQTTALGMTEVLGLPVLLHMADGDMVCRVDALMNDRQVHELSILLRTMVKGLESLKMAYPGHIELMISGGE